MSDFVDTFCPECDTNVRAILREQPARLRVRGEKVDFTETVAICPSCGAEIGDSRIEGENLDRAYAAYRARHGIPSPEEIRRLRDFYGLSLREFSRFLGFGEQTVYRYEHGDIPDVTHSLVLEQAQTSEGAQRLLAKNRERLSRRSVESIELALSTPAEELAWMRSLPSRLEGQAEDAPSAKNGYRAFDPDRAMALTYLLAQRCKDLFWTKSQKALFFADMFSYACRGRSLTGLRYAHATHGPVADGREGLRYLLAADDIVEFRERDWGEVLVPGKPLVNDPFSEAEHELIDGVAHFVNSFSTAHEISDFSHELVCWQDTTDGQVIDYAEAAEEVARAMGARMPELGGLVTR